MSNIITPPTVNPTTVATFSGLASGINTSGIISNMQVFAQQQVTVLQNQDAVYQAQVTAYQSLNTAVAAVQSAALALTIPATFSANSATSSNTAVASITASAGALDGTHTLTVNTLAQAQQIVSNPYGSDNLGLGEAGAFTLNGHAITITATDSLASIASKINSAGAGVTANVADVGANTYRLSVTSDSSGVAHTISAANTTGSVLNDLGLVGTSPAVIRQAVGTTGAASITASSASTPLGTLFGYASGAAPSGPVTIGDGTDASGTVSIDLNTDSLSAIANEINAAGITGISAQVIALPDSNGNPGGGGQQLRIVSSSGKAPVFTDSNSVLSSIGVIQQATVSGNQPIAAQDANFTFDNLTYTRASNNVGDLISGASVTLLQQTPTGTGATPATTTLTVAQNTASISTAIQNFTTAYNNANDFISNQNAFTPPTANTEGVQDQTSPLFGSQVLRDVASQLANALTVASGTTTLASIGITTDPTSGDLVVNSAALTSALQSNSTAVQNLFGVGGTSNNGSVQFVSAGTKTQPSSGGGFAVNITTAASQTTVDAVSQQIGNSTQAETLTFAGNNFHTPVTLTLNVGNNIEHTINQINGDSQLSGIVSASQDANGNLLISSTAYGSNTGFTVASNLAAGATNSGIGLSPVVTAGTDVAGTINGELATGTGQTLVANAGNKTTDGLALTVTATQPGAYGTVSVTQGIGTQLNNVLATILNPKTGEIAGAENALNTNTTANTTQITNVENEVVSQTTFLQQMFATMETQISALQSQGTAFQTISNGLESNPPSTGTTSAGTNTSGGATG
jgi:flagellar hook-associated protein 2